MLGGREFVFRRERAVDRPDIQRAPVGRDLPPDVVGYVGEGHDRFALRECGQHPSGHIDDRRDSWRESALEKFERLHPWKECGDCAFIPTCAGGCVAASQSQLGDMNMPTCHKPTFESALIALAHTAASAAN